MKAFAASVRRRARELAAIPYLARSGAFDRTFYVRQYPDVAALRFLPPLLHYVRHGAAEGRKPNSWFDSAFYLEQNSDVRTAGINPLLHYLRHGKLEGRRPASPLRYLEENLELPLRELLEVIQRRILEDSTYFGVRAHKNPTDWWIYQEIVVERRPDIVVEIGCRYGGTTLALAHLCDLLGSGRVIGIDVDLSLVAERVRSHPRVTLLEGDACASFATVAEACRTAREVLIIEDSSHLYESTLAVLKTYAPLIRPGGYFIVEDSICHHGLKVGPRPGPYEAIEAFVKNDGRFDIDRTREAFLVTWNPKGFLRRRSEPSTTAGDDRSG